MPALTSSSAGGGSSALSGASAVVIGRLSANDTRGRYRAVILASPFAPCCLHPACSFPYTEPDGRPPRAYRPRRWHAGGAGERHRGIQQVALLRLPRDARGRLARSG